MTWLNGLFIHWPFEPERIRPYVPTSLELDTYDGRAWVGVLSFILSNAGMAYSPSFTRLTFPEVNVRTYVEYNGAPGLYFFSIDIGNSILPTLIRKTMRLPCFTADADVDSQGTQIHFRSSRKRATQPLAQLDVSYQPRGEPFLADPGSLDHWLVERRRLYDPIGKGVLYADIAHQPWQLCPARATIHENTLFEVNGLPTPEYQPWFHYSEKRAMTGSIPRVIDAEDPAVNTLSEADP